MVGAAGPGAANSWCDERSNNGIVANRFAILRHSLPDRGAEEQAAKLASSADEARRLAEPERAMRVLELLKDADALDRVRLGLGECADPRQLRHEATIELIPFAAALYALLA
jgi:hypothetical protein